jgi:hypothetical protein
VRRVQVYVELSDVDYKQYEDEATRCGVTVESLVQKMVQGLVREMMREEQEGTDHPIVL